MGYGSVPVHAVPASPLNSVQFNDGGVFGGDADFTWDKTTNQLAFLGTNTTLLIQAVSATPAAPAAGRVTVFGSEIAAQVLLTQRGPTGTDKPLQPHFAFSVVGFYAPTGNSAALLSVVRFQNLTTGALTARNVATTNLFTSTRRLGYQSAAGAGSSAGTRHGLAQFWRGNAPGLGGFFYEAMFGIALQSGGEHRAFVGLWGTVTALPNADPSAQTDIVGMGADVGDTEWQIIHNDAAGVATKVPLGANFPFPGTVNQDFYELVVHAPPNGTTISWRVRRLDTGATASGVISTNMPANTTLLSSILQLNNGATAAAVALDVMQQYIETDF